MTWQLVDLPPGWKTIGCKCILKKKLNTNGSIDKYKARIVAKELKQKSDIDLFDTFSHVTRITYIHLLIAVASIHNFIVHQIDMKSAFLHGDFEEEWHEKFDHCILTNGFKCNEMILAFIICLEINCILLCAYMLMICLCLALIWILWILLKENFAQK